RRRRAEQDAKKTFAEVARLTLAKKAGGWKGAERSTSYAAWVRTIDVEAKALHRLAVDEIGVAEVMLELSYRISEGRASCHGWRATLRSWMADHSVPFEVAEAALAHSKGGVVEA